MDSAPSDAPRQSILGSINFLSRSSRPRPDQPPLPNNNNSSTTTPASPPLSAQPLPPTTTSSSMNQRRRTVAGAQAPPAAQATPNPGGLGYMLRGRRSANTNTNNGSQQQQQQQQERERQGRQSPLAMPPPPHTTTPRAQPTGPTHRIRLVPHLDSSRSLHFEAIGRDVRQGDPPLRIGRFTEQPGSTSSKVAFKSKVVSRGHAEVWFDAGTWYIKDTKSSSGTFLNHIRLSPPNTESRPYAIKDGDVLQLGVDYQGGTEEIYRCVKMRVELGREWQSGVNAFNSNALQQLKALSAPTKTSPSSKLKPTTIPKAPVSVADCVICLCPVTVCQALFIAPCSHAYHYKCIRPLLQMHHPGFSCPICRTFADLEADVESEGVCMVLEGMTGSGEGEGGGVDAEGDVEMAMAGVGAIPIVMEEEEGEDDGERSVTGSAPDLDADFANPFRPPHPHSHAHALAVPALANLTTPARNPSLPGGDDTDLDREPPTALGSSAPVDSSVPIDPIRLAPPVIATSQNPFATSAMPSVSPTTSTTSSNPFEGHPNHETSGMNPMPIPPPPGLNIGGMNLAGFGMPGVAVGMMGAATWGGMAGGSGGGVIREEDIGEGGEGIEGEGEEVGGKRKR
ncbi:hypothetical protein M422DRAFT_28107 [Sphaerobolus stellatus SS14]|nr:hypothetical protein M422DRAFT_28107 [Sphaerobolus stellatus SS14]